MHPRTLVLLGAPLLLASASAARATGYYLVLGTSESTFTVVGFQGFSTTPTHYYGNTTFPGDDAFPPYAALYDFNGDGIPEVITTRSDVTTVEVQDWTTGAVLADFQLPLQANGQPYLGGPITVSGSTITVAAGGLGEPGEVNFNFVYDPPGDPLAASPIFDLDGDGIADKVVFGGGDVLFATNGATNLSTDFSAGLLAFPDAPVKIITWTPSAAIATPEPASLTLLYLAAPLLLRRRRTRL